MRIFVFVTAFLCFAAVCMINESVAQPETEKYVWPIDDPTFFTGTLGAANNLISGTIEEYRPAEGTTLQHFHEGVDMPYIPGTSVWYQ